MSVESRLRSTLVFGLSMRGMAGAEENNLAPGNESADDAAPADGSGTGDGTGGTGGTGGGTGGGGSGTGGGAGGGGAGGDSPPAGSYVADENFTTCKTKYGISEAEATAIDYEGSAHPFGTTPEGKARERAWRATLPQTSDATGNVPANDSTTKPVECKDIPDDPPYTLQLSKHYTLGDFTNHALLPHNLVPNKGLTKAQIACNLRHLAVTILDPIYDHFQPLGYTIKISSGFRPESGASDHNIGSAADLQFMHSNVSGGRVTGPNMARIMKEINEGLKLPYTQMIFEMDRLLHVACRRTGNKSSVPMFWSYDNGQTRAGTNYRYNVQLTGLPPVA